MVLNNEIICNVCSLKASEDEHAVFIRAHKNNKPVDICTSCIPSVIHGSGMVVKSDEEIIKDLD
ncbi:MULTISPECIES: hypothetical protein [unclassified Campylobacter]|uniref:hypothetical protein n=1 Tax=unclassified Campylobacter TaxID=2593542 RepID=UPI001BDB6CC3|nr:MULTISPECIES: hypothetical protein [unclassified Campylobacter]MBZ7975844.1 hypothetical protein [Campylobacter sp. RM12637]MBZ7978498.1 hypothetical protein [Campylobacter sp. RM12654]MBZ7980841.1 hypothetical protein [Campylobacter sp. RM12642]MBZ7982790.1 hypothetical protein [Campylobacter sp. RM12640]MBZ7982902.1 hypothetical protein [Campylobacter sp. RM12647]MBZ7990070.1 hypothetical protein [Campylobacter sp. RM12635]MBZ7991164.1 hypothetical protein [Campylobacter sp. RM9331]MBZ